MAKIKVTCECGHTAEYDESEIHSHRLICGDSTDSAVIDRLMDGVKADVVLTDAPYGVSAVNSEGTVIGYGENHLAERGKYAPIIGDDTTETAQTSYHVAVINSDNQIIFGGNYFTDFLPPSRCWIVWDKEIAEGMKFADGELAWSSMDANLKIYRYMWSGMKRKGNRDIEGKKRVHPTQKPVGLMANILNDFASPKSAILDLFGGSGSTLIACEQTGRICYMAELSPKYVDVIIQRWENFTGQKAVLLDD